MLFSNIIFKFIEYLLLGPIISDIHVPQLHNLSMLKKSREQFISQAVTNMNIIERYRSWL